MSDQVIAEHEEHIFMLIQEYLGSKKIVEVDKIVLYLNNTLSKSHSLLNMEGIKHIINNLLAKKRIIEGCHLTKTEILINPKRKAIYDYICSNPGVYHYLIIKNLNIPNHIAVWHLDALVKFEFVKTIQIDGHLLYYDSTIQSKTAILGYYNRNEKSRAIIDWLKDNPKGCSKTQIATHFKMHPNTVKKYIDDLKKNGLIEQKTSKIFILTSSIN